MPWEKKGEKRKWVEEKIEKGSQQPGAFSGPTPTNPMPHDVVWSSPNTLKSNNSLAPTTPLFSRFPLFHSNIDFFFSGFLPISSIFMVACGFGFWVLVILILQPMFTLSSICFIFPISCFSYLCVCQFAHLLVIISLFSNGCQLSFNWFDNVCIWNWATTEEESTLM